MPRCLGRPQDGASLAVRPAQPVAACFLSEADRISIADGLLRRVSIRGIAVQLGRPPSTISREIRRNRGAASIAYHPSARSAALGQVGDQHGALEMALLVARGAVNLGRRTRRRR